MNATTACRAMRLRSNHWPPDWPLPTGAQTVMFRALQRARPGAFIACGCHDDSTFRVVVIYGGNGGRYGGRVHCREYVLLPSGQLRHVLAGVPYTEEIRDAA